MKKFSLSLLAVTCTLALTACGSGGGSGSNNTSAAPAKTAQQIEAERLASEKAAAEKAAAEKAAAEKAAEQAETARIAAVKSNLDSVFVQNTETYQGKNRFGSDRTFAQLSGSTANASAATFNTENIKGAKEANLNELVIGTTKIKLLSDEEIHSWAKGSNASEREKLGVLSKNLTDIDASGAKVSGKVNAFSEKVNAENLAQTRYGYVTIDGVTHFFVQGYQTPVAGTAEVNSPFNLSAYTRTATPASGQAVRIAEMPTDKILAYKGQAFYGKDGIYNPLDMAATADLSNKKVKVVLSEAGADKFTFGGNIDGSNFAGNVNGVVTKGAFYGPKALDIGGIFYVTEGANKNNNGVYGGTQQNCSLLGACAEGTEVLKDFEVGKIQ